MKLTTLTLLSVASIALLSACGHKDHDHDTTQDDSSAHTHDLSCDHEHENHGHQHGDDCDHDAEKKAHEHGAGCDHAHVVAGPNKSRMITSVSPAAEFMVLDNRSVHIQFYDGNMQAIAPSTQQVSVVSGERSNPVELRFTQQGNKLVSNAALPEGSNFPTTVAIKENPDSKLVLEKFTLNLADCSGCENKEYSCECSH